MKTKIILGIILIFAASLRLWGISTNPPSLSWDEVSIGYNAYTILNYGMDEHGVRMPIGAFAAFGDYKPALPIYVTVPFVAVFGLSELAVRLPSALFGIATVFLLYFFVKELFGNQTKAVEVVALLSSLLLAFSPWHIMLSRAGFEANIATFFILLGVYLIVAARRNARLWMYAFLPFAAGMYTFNSARFAGPLIGLGALVFSWGSLQNAKTVAVRGVVIAAIVLVPLLPHLVSRQAKLRFEEVSIFTDLRVVLISNARRVIDGNTWWSAIVHNRRIGFGREYLVHFFDNLEPRFLFIRGDGNPKFSIQDSGQLLLVTAPFVFYGWLMLVAKMPAVGGLLLWWLIASIAPAAVARETPHALRIENGLPVWIIVTAYGAIAAIMGISIRKLRLLLTIFSLLLLVANFGYFWHNYMNHYTLEYSGEWQYGYREAIQFAESQKDSYDTIVLTESIGRPYMYALFYGKYDLPYFLNSKDASFDAAGFYNVTALGNYRFVREEIGDLLKNTLYILPPSQVPAGAHIVKTVNRLNGDPALVIFDI
jgi:4-amino-4-deoxy-L-arabinose transferase-like glycosyltransferase